METVRMFEKYEYAEITEELADIHPSLYRFCDVRDEVSYRYGSIPKAENISNIVELAEEGKLDKNIAYVLYCMKGIQSMDMAYELRGMGYDAVSLKGGYAAWLTSSYREDYEDKQKEVETSIRKTFHKCIFSPFAKAINEYELLKPGDKVAVCISGGKDSMLMAKLFQEIKRHNKFDFELVFLVMDPGYSEVNRLVIEKNARMLGVPITIFETQIFDAVYDVKQSPCYLCARMRRGYLYSKAKELGCNKIALGHHYDDVIETILMSMLYGGQIQTMMPKLHSNNFKGMEVIRPLYLIHEDDIKAWAKHNNLYFIQCACKFTQACANETCLTQSKSKRLEMKNLIKELKKVNPFVEQNIFKSVENVSLKTVIAYKDDHARHHFLDTYDEEGNE